MRDLYKVCKNWFGGNVKWKIGDDRRVKFCENKWDDDQPLKDKFQRLFSLSLYKEATVAEIGT